MRQKPSSEKPPSVTRQWIWGFHSRGRPKVWRTQINQGQSSWTCLTWKHTKNDTAYSMKQAVKKRTVFQEEMAKIFINSKDTVTVRALDELESHGVGSVLAIFDAASWAELAFATERNKFKVTAFGTGIHCTAESRVTAVNHFVTLSMTTWRGCKMYTISS